MRRVIKDILKQLLSVVTVEEAERTARNQPHLKFAADGTRRSNRVGTVTAVTTNTQLSCIMVTYNFL